MPPGGQAQPGDSGEHHHDQEEGGSSIRQDIWGQSQAEIENDMSAIRDQFKDMFSCIGEIKLPLIEIYMMEGAKPVAQKQRPISIHMMEPLKEKLVEFVQEEVLESKHARGWVHNVVLTKKKWNERAISLNIDTRSMEKYVDMSHFPIPTSEN